MENNTPLVSVIMPAYNMEKYIADSIESVLNQDYNNWELIVMDDGSVDGTADIVKKYAEKDARIKYYYQENQKLSLARNNAISKSSGELIAFLDSDDLWLPQKLSVSVSEFLSSDQDMLFTGSYAFYTTEDLDNISNLDRMIVENKTHRGEEAISEFLRMNRVPVLTVVIKRDVLDSIGRFPVISFAEDYNAWLLLLLNNYTLRGIGQPLSIYRLRQDSMTGSALNISNNILNMFTELSIQYPVIRTDFKNDIKCWVKEYAEKNLTANNVSDLMNHVVYFGLDTPKLRFLNKIRAVLPFSLYKSLIKSIFK